MRRGEVYLVSRPGGNDPRRDRPVVVVSRQASIDSNYNSVVCAPIHSQYHGQSSQVLVGEESGLKHASAVHCDSLTSFRKAQLTRYIGALGPDRIAALDRALAVAIGIDQLLED